MCLGNVGEMCEKVGEGRERYGECVGTCGTWGNGFLIY